jgi:sodium/proline symporter
MSGLATSTVTTVGAVMVGYLGILLGIGWWASRRTHGGEDFHLAGRSLGAWAAGVSSTASSESGWVTLGAVGMTWVHGISGLWYAPGCLLGYLVNLYLLAPRLRRLSETQGSLTLTDVITGRWGDPRHVLRVTATSIILLCMMGYVAAQMTSAGKAFSQSLGLEESGFGYLLGVLVGAAVITIVTFLGGFRAVAWTDLFQGLLVAGALIALPLYAVARLGGFGSLTAALAAVEPSLVTAAGDRVGPALWGFVIGQLGIGLGYPGMPHVVTRYMATRSQAEVRRLKTIAMLWGVAVFYGAGLVGLVGRVMLPTMADPEQTLMAMALELLHPVVAGLMLAAVISAILSTVSSQLLVAASAVSYDVVERAFSYGADDRRSLVLGRWTVVIVGVLGILVALTKTRVVFWFVLFAWSGLGAAFAPLMLFAVFGRLVNRHGALAGMLTGFGVTVSWYMGIQAADNPAFDHMWWAILVGGAAILATGRVTGAFAVGHIAAVLAATALTLLSWWLVQRWQLHNLYELVPAFVLAAGSALVVSRLFPADSDEMSHVKRETSIVRRSPPTQEEAPSASDV